MSIARKRPRWVWWPTRSRALVSATGWTVVTLINGYLVSRLTGVWALVLVGAVIAGFLAIVGWSSYSYCRRHPEVEQAAGLGNRW